MLARMGRSVVQELFHLGEGLLGGIGLLRGNGAERGEHSEVNGARIIKEGAHDFLDEFLALRIEEWGRVVVGGELLGGAILGFDVLVRLVLGFAGPGVIEALEGFRDVVEHGDVDAAVVVVPVQIEAEVALAGLVARNGVVFLEDEFEMVGVLPPHILDAEIIHAKGERYGPPVVGPETGGEVALAVPCTVEALL